MKNLNKFNRQESESHRHESVIVATDFGSTVISLEHLNQEKVEKAKAEQQAEFEEARDKVYDFFASQESDAESSIDNHQSRVEIATVEGQIYDADIVREVSDRLEKARENGSSLFEHDDPRSNKPIDYGVRFSGVHADYDQGLIERPDRHCTQEHLNREVSSVKSVQREISVRQKFANITDAFLQSIGL